MKTITTTVATLLASLVLTGGAMAQNENQPAGQPASQPAAQPGAQPPAQLVEVPKAAPRVPPAPAVWTDPELGKIGDMLKGTWKTTAPVAQSGGEAGATADVVMSIAHVRNTELPNTLYVEAARLDSMHAPYRQAMFQLYKSKGKVRMRTFEFAGYATDPNAFVGLWTIPNSFPDISKSSLIATMDIELAAKGPGYSGKSPYAYPTGRGEAVEMTSEIVVGPDSMTVADRGFDAEGKVVWGSAASEKYTFTRFNSPVKVDARPNGLVIIDFVHPSEGQTIVANDRVSVQYSGWLMNGFRFDSSRTRNQPYTYSQGGMIAGWNEGMIGATKGTIRRLFVPGELGFAEKGNARAQIPANADLVFDIEVLHIETPPPPAAPVTPPPAPGAAPATDASGKPIEAKPVEDKPAEQPK